MLYSSLGVAIVLSILAAYYYGWWHSLTTTWGWLLPSVEGLHHSGVLAWVCFWYDKIILEHIGSSSITYYSTYFGLLALCYFSSVVMHILNESRILFIKVLWWLFVRVVKPWCCGVWSSTVIATLLFSNATWHKLLLEIDLRTSFINRASTWKLSSRVEFAIRLIKSISCAISCWLSLTRSCSIHCIWFLLCERTQVNSSRSCVLQWLIAIMRDCAVIKNTVVLTIEVILVLRWVTNSSVYPLLSDFRLCLCFWNRLTRGSIVSY
jgi:hypothetical protein